MIRNDLYISKEAFIVLDTYSLESIFEAANLIALESENSQDKNETIPKKEKRRSKFKFMKEQMVGRGITDALYHGYKYGSAADSLNRSGLFRIRIDKGGSIVNGMINGAVSGVAKGAASGLIGGLANDMYYRKHGKNMSRATAGTIGAGITGGLDGVSKNGSDSYIVNKALNNAVAGGLVGALYEKNKNNDDD